MTVPATMYAIAYHPSHTGPAQTLEHYTDVNSATVLAHQLLEKLRKQGRGGEVQVVRTDDDQTVVLRLPLVAQPTHIPKPRRPARGTHGVMHHPGWMTRPH